MSGALAARIRHAALRSVGAGKLVIALGAVVAGGVGLAACTGDAGDGLGGSVRMEWRAARRASATSDTTGSAAPGAPPGATSGAAPGATSAAAPGATSAAAPGTTSGAAAATKRDSVAAAKRDSVVAAKRDSVVAAKRDSVAAGTRDTTGRAGRDTAAGARPSPAPAASPVGSMRGRGVVVWCAGPKLAIITGVQGDSGIGLVVHPRDSLVPGTYRVLDPDSARAVAPAAAVALRLMTRSAIEGFQGRSGTLTITKVRDRRFSGKLQAEIDGVGAARWLDLQGELSDLPIHIGGSACPS